MALERVHHNLVSRLAESDDLRERLRQSPEEVLAEFGVAAAVPDVVTLPSKDAVRLAISACNPAVRACCGWTS